MQDLHAIGGAGVGGGGAGAGAGRFFSGGGGDRRLRPHNHQALKCPRCDSLNTKFCYYNNYNLSQPRHFCKACRRYWTKGGVLRSVPVGGGCRKTKRSKPKSSAADAPRERKSKAQSSSSTDSSSLTASTPTSAAVAEVGSALSATTTSNSATTMYSFSDAMFFSVNPPANPNFDNHQPLLNHSSSESQIFTEMGSFTSLMTSSGNAAGMMGFSMGDIPTTSYDRLQQVSGAENQAISEMVGPSDVDEFKMQDMTGGISNDGLAAALDHWGSGTGSGEDQGLFDLSAAVDPAYWSQPQWTDTDDTLNYLP